MQYLSSLIQYIDLIHQCLRSIGEFKYYRKSLVDETIKIGTESIAIVGLIGIFTGAVFTVLMAYQLTHPLVPRITIGSIVVQTMLLEMAAVLSGLVLAGKVGARITSEIGTMRISEQIDALESMGFNSISFLIVPRIIVGCVIFPVLYLYASFFGIVGGMLAGDLADILSIDVFMRGAQLIFVPQDFVFGFTKSATFGFIITSIACYKGYYVYGGSEGIGKHTTQTIVLSSIFILLTDLLFAIILL